MLIIEGADCVGKTTLAKHLAQGLDSDGYVYQHLGILPKGFDFYWDHVALSSKRVVQDRFYLSEVIYSKVLNRKPCINDAEIWLLEGYLRNLGVYTVIVLGDDKIITERYDREREAFTLVEILHINDVYAANDTHDLFVDAEDTCNPAIHEKILSEYRRRQYAVDSILHRRRS